MRCVAETFGNWGRRHNVAAMIFQDAYSGLKRISAKRCHWVLKEDQ
jgi:hypothetical protein